MTNIGKHILKLRQQKNMTQDDLAERLFVTRQTVSNYETGKSRPDVEMLMRIAEVLETDIQSILYGPAEPVSRMPAAVRFAIGFSASLLFFLLWRILTPITLELRSLRFLTGPYIAVSILLKPLFYLFSGWTLCQLVAVVINKPYNLPFWTTYVRRVLLALLIVWLILVLWFSTELLWDTYRALIASGPYTSSIKTPLGLQNFLLRLYAGAGNPFGLHTNPGIFSFLGASLWICGFPAKKQP